MGDRKKNSQMNSEENKMKDAEMKAIERLLDAPTCYPEKQRKPRMRRKEDLISWMDKYSEINEVYNLYGMDCEEAANCDEWLDRGIFRKQRHDINAQFYPSVSKFPLDYTLLMRDKRMFEGFAQMVLGYGNHYCPSLAYVMGDKFYIKETGQADLQADFSEFISAHDNSKLVFKQAFGCGAEQVYVVEIKNKAIVWKTKAYIPADFLCKICSHTTNWIIQDFICQHHEMNKLNQSSVNTMRIITYHTGDRISASNAVVRFGRPGASVDNQCFFAGVDQNGYVMSDKFDFVNKSRSHCEKAGLRIPFFAEANLLVKQMHEYIPEIFTIGWDVAFTEKGPILIEGNDGWDPFLTQTPPGNQQRKIYEQLAAKRQEYYHF